MEIPTPIIVLWGVATTAIAVLGLGWVFWRSKQRAPEEETRELLYREIGGGRIGSINYTFPFVDIRLYDDRLVLSAAWNTIIPLDEIETMEVTSRMFYDSVVVHMAPDHDGDRRYRIFSTRADHLVDAISEQQDSPEA